MIYKYNFRFNAKHNTSKDLNPDAIHVHTFEVICYTEQTEFRYNIVEPKVKEYLKQFTGVYLNDILSEIPTIENLAEKFFIEINQLSNEYQLLKLELSDKPTQTYIIGEL